MQDFHARLVEHLIFPLSQGLRRCNYKVKLEEARFNQSLSREQIRALQFKKLGELLQHSYRFVPYYRDLFQQMGITPEDIRTWEDFEALPILTRADVRDQMDRLISEKPRSPVRKYTTSGSTGKPLTVLTSQIAIAAEYACLYRALEQWGIKIGDRTLFIRGDDRTLFHPNWRTRFGRRFFIPLKDWVFNRRVLPVNTISEIKLEVQLRLLRKFKPVYLSGYPSALYLLALKIIDSDADIGSIGMKLVRTSSEMLYGDHKNTLQEVFKCPVADNYGSFEMGIAANTFPCGALHTNDDFVIVEVIQSNPQDNFGRVIATRLDNWEFPLIRYDSEDLASPLMVHDNCSCGLPLQMIETIIGREFETVRLADGRLLHDNYFISLLKYTPGVRHYQVHQKDLTKFDILIVLDPESSLHDAETYILERMRLFLGDVEVSVIAVERIQPGPSGKFHMVHSDLRT